MAKKSDWIIGGALVASVFVLMMVVGFTLLSALIDDGDGFSYGSEQRVGVIEINGVINNARDVIAQVSRYREDETIPVIVLRIDSPGGVVAPTQEIYDEIRKTRETGKPVIASMGSVAASGGYYIACAADSIVANPGTLTGSIGVIFELPNAEGLFNKLGINWEVVKSGEYKDIGSFARRLTDDERKLMQVLVDDVYNQFIDVVAKHRPLTRKQVVALADGRVFTGNQAKALGLVDRLGTYQDAIELAARMVGITGKPKIIRPREKTIFDLLVSNMESTIQAYSSVFLEYRLR